MEVLLRLKHWQIFMLTFGIMMIVIIARVIVMLAETELFGGLLDVVMMERITELVSVATGLAQVSWLYIVGLRLAEKRPTDNFNERLFRNALYITAGISVLQSIIFPLVHYIAPIQINLFLGIVSLIAGLYTYYFVAKGLKSVEMDREVGFNDFTGDFFSLVFFPIGVWWIQPRINDIFDKESRPFDPDAPLDQHVTM